MWSVAADVIWWFVTVYVLGFFPIALHLLSVVLNEAPSDLTNAKLTVHFWTQFNEVAIGDGYLYAFIIALAAVVETFGEEGSINKNVSIGFTIGACAALFLYFLSLLALASSNQLVGLGLKIYVWIHLAMIAVSYLVYRILKFYGKAAEDWEEAEKSLSGGAPATPAAR